MERNMAKHVLGLNFGQKLRGNLPVHRKLSLDNLAQPQHRKRLCSDNPAAHLELSPPSLASFLLPYISMRHYGSFWQHWFSTVSSVPRAWRVGHRAHCAEMRRAVSSEPCCRDDG